MSAFVLRFGRLGIAYAGVSDITGWRRWCASWRDFWPVYGIRYNGYGRC